MGTFVIAEAGSSHDNDLLKAYRLIEAAKECGADAVKFQWTSDAVEMAERRGFDDGNVAIMYRTYLEKPVSWLESLKAYADKVGIEFMCTVYLIEDIATIAPLVKRFKVSAFEAKWTEFVDAHLPYHKQIIISNGPNSRTAYPGFIKNPCDIQNLHCVSKYPAALEDYDLKRLWPDEMGSDDGLSDHTANVLTGAAAVAAGARIVEVHCRLFDTSPDNPDYGHSLPADCACQSDYSGGICLHQYIKHIRTVERML